MRPAALASAFGRETFQPVLRQTRLPISSLRAGVRPARAGKIDRGRSIAISRMRRLIKRIARRRLPDRRLQQRQLARPAYIHFEALLRPGRPLASLDSLQSFFSTSCSICLSSDAGSATMFLT
jgi:hypothetical protein